jgi:hypothetical protein
MESSYKNIWAFTSQEYRTQLERFAQIIQFAGVGAHHHNGVAERSVQTVMAIARTVLLRAFAHNPLARQREQPHWFASLDNQPHRLLALTNNGVLCILHCSKICIDLQVLTNNGIILLSIPPEHSRELVILAAENEDHVEVRALLMLQFRGWRTISSVQLLSTWLVDAEKIWGST